MRVFGSSLQEHAAGQRRLRDQSVVAGDLGALGVERNAVGEVTEYDA